MTKTDLIRVVADKTGLKQSDAQTAVNAVLESVLEALISGDKVSLIGFGVFEVRSKSARLFRKPTTGEMIEVEASKAPVWRASKCLKDRVNN